MELGNITEYKGVPILEVHVGNQTGYLSPFRGYRFQVSGTISGQGDFGSTSVTELEILSDDVLYDLAELAIVKYQTYLKNIEKENVNVQYIVSVNDQYKLRDFIKHSREWLRRVK